MPSRTGSAVSGGWNYMCEHGDEMGCTLCMFCMHGRVSGVRTCVYVFPPSGDWGVVGMTHAYAGLCLCPQIRRVSAGACSRRGSTKHKSHISWLQETMHSPLIALTPLPPLPFRPPVLPSLSGQARLRLGAWERCSSVRDRVLQPRVQHPEVSEGLGNT